MNTTSITIYGASDDLLEVEGDVEDEFGAYGPQAGDTAATISDEQIRADISAALAPFLLAL